MIEKSYLMKLLRVFVATTDNLDQEQIDQLIAGKAKLAFVSTDAAKKTNHAPVVNQSNLLTRLNECKDRDEARNILNVIERRDALAAVARALKVHVVKNDRREDIESKIIEFVIGGKLRTEAIRTLNLKGGGDNRRS